jgi:hypothetical protein
MEQAVGTAEIVGTVSTGVAFDIATRLLTSIFVTGRTGDTVSIFAPVATAAQIGSGLWRGVAPGSAGQIAMLEDVTILSQGTVSINLQQIEEPADQTAGNRRRGMFVVLAQFN